ncbi:TPA: TraK family protein [Yersinia enterocolitica]|uniref:TraK family protein n=1 Tax=Yersinia enterocolitica TaxID=630 RepID=UPI0029B34CF4|nr:TraK family protein [Yersinia enterocolitica]EKN5104300.1 conjugal transfer protein TraK [Yersinia enterocolitica]EKN6091067.1 conjugal transfer protein TraK [Yersinia enterocolitica]ELX2238826.1 TraK family protein [Yersinia enterocolitica]ELY5242030.1 TraK family protein [Yersinia enterocolitica]
MAKSLSQRIAERQKLLSPLGRGGANRAEFLAQREDIADALQDGWSIKQIWDTLYDEGKITFSYDPFTKYVKNIIRSKKQHSVLSGVQQGQIPEQKPKDAQPQTPKSIFSTGLPKFQHNPGADNDN